MSQAGPVTRRTAQKQLIQQALADEVGFISAQALHRRLQESGAAVGLATVYRQLGTLAAAGALDTIAVDGTQLYRVCQPQVHHHHHLVCESCGRAIEISLPDESWPQAIARQHGFTATRHIVEIFGRCGQCA